MSDPRVPFVDLKAQYAAIRGEIGPALQQVLDSATFVLGPSVIEFEQQFARSLGRRHCVATSTGTSALHLALICAGVKPGQEVATVSHTFIATTWAVSYVGAKPVFVDIEPKTYTMDPTKLEDVLTERTAAVLPVHLYGQPADLAALTEICTRRGIPLIEDCAQSHAASYRGRPAGTFGPMACFSFYPGKNLGAYGEGGAVVTDDEQVAKRLRSLRDHGQSERYHHEEVGFNYRMEGFQGAVLATKLRHLETWTEARRKAARNYDRLLAGTSLVLPVEAEGRRHVYHLYVVRHPERDRLRAHLEERSIGVGLHYPIPVHRQKAYAHLGLSEGSYPVSERVARECLSLPIFPEISLAQQEYVAEAVRAFDGK